MLSPHTSPGPGTPGSPPVAGEALNFESQFHNHGQDQFKNSGSGNQINGASFYGTVYIGAQVYQTSPGISTAHLASKLKEATERELYKSALYESETVARYLLQGGDINIRGQDGAGLLHQAADHGHTAITRLLLSKGADVMARNNNAGTPLHRAAWSGSEVVARLLLDGGANVGAANLGGHTPLHLAAEKGYTGVAQVLLQRGASVSAVNQAGGTPLHRAAYCGHVEVARLLLNHQSNYQARNRQGYRPSDLASMRGHHAVVQLIAQRYYYGRC